MAPNCDNKENRFAIHERKGKKMDGAFDLTSELDAYINAIGTNIRMQRLESFATFNYLAEKNAIVLLGDSITEGFLIHEMYRGSSPIYNRGISGDTSQDVLNRLQESVYALDPAKVFLLIGTNDITPCSIKTPIG